MRLPDGVRRFMLDMLKRDAEARCALDELDKLDELEELDEWDAWDELDDWDDWDELSTKHLLERIFLGKKSAKPEKPLPPSLADWLSTAAEQMRWKRARPYASSELGGHLSDQYEAFQADGMDETAAADATVREMGDPVETGTQLDRAWRPRPDWIMLSIVLLLAAAGLVIQYLFRCQMGYRGMGWLFYVGSYITGVFFLLAAYFLDYTLLGKYCWTLYGLWIAGGVLALYFAEVYGGRNLCLYRWVWWFPVLFAGVLYKQRGKGADGILLCCAAMLPMMLMAMYASSLNAIITITGVSCAMLAGAVWRGVFGRRTKVKMVLAVLPVLFGIALFTLYILISGDISPVVIFFNPFSDPQNMGYQGTMIRLAMLGGSMSDNQAEAVQMYMDTSSHYASDLVLTNIKYYWGWLAFALALGALLFLLIRGFMLARRQKALLAWCVSFMAVLTLAAQTIKYVLQNFGFIFSGAYGLPLLSYGRIYLCQTMVLFGLLLSTWRMGKMESGMPSLPKPEKEHGNKI